MAAGGSDLGSVWTHGREGRRSQQMSTETRERPESRGLKRATCWASRGANPGTWGGPARLGGRPRRLPFTPSPRRGRCSSLLAIGPSRCQSPPHPPMSLHHWLTGPRGSQGKQSDPNPTSSPRTHPGPMGKHRLPARPHWLVYIAVTSSVRPASPNEGGGGAVSWG